MKPRFSNQRNHALTLMEVLVVIVVLAVFAAMLLPANNGSRRKAVAMRINCVNNLKQIGLAYRIWAGDHNGKYPMEVSVRNGGTMEFAAEGKNGWLNYFIMSNELSTPKILMCSADTSRFPPATNYTSELSDKISYFVGLDANQTNTQRLLSGDDNLAMDDIPVKSGSLELSTNTPITWTATRHINPGNIGLADGSVQQLNQKGLQQAFQQTGLATNRLAIP